MNISKRVFDILISLLGLIVLSPILFIISLLIYLAMSRPIIFKQIRTGYCGRPFTIYKFRTMNNNENSNTITVKGDERITKLGRVLRKFKVDELPELWNVLIGDMSLVGPRPDMPYYIDKLKNEERNILLLKPGITGPATLKYANEEEILAKVSDPVKYNDEIIYPEKIKLNLEYYHNNSFLGDIKILIRTIFRSNY